MAETGRGLLGVGGQRHPGLDPEQLGAGRAGLRRSALGMGDTAACSHPVDRAGPDRLQRAETVAVDDLAPDQVGHRGEPDVRMRPHVDALAEQELRRPHLIEKDERPDHLPARRWQRPAHFEAAEIARPRHDDHLDRVDLLLLVAFWVGRRLPAHCLGPLACFVPPRLWQHGAAGARVFLRAMLPNSATRRRLRPRLRAPATRRARGKRQPPEGLSGKNSFDVLHSRTFRGGFPQQRSGHDHQRSGARSARI